MIRQPHQSNRDLGWAFESGRSAVLVRASDHGTEIPRYESRILVGQDVGLDVAEGCLRLVLDTIVERLDDVLFEARRRGNALVTASRCGSVKDS